MSPEVQLTFYTATTTVLVAVAFLYLWFRLRSPRLLTFGASFACLALLGIYLGFGAVYGAYPFRQQIAAGTIIASISFLVAGCIAHAGIRVPWKAIAVLAVGLWVFNQVLFATTGILSVAYNPFLVGLVWIGVSALFFRYRATRGGRILAVLFLLRGVMHLPWPFVLFTPAMAFIQAMDNAFVIAIGLALVVVELLRARTDLAGANDELRAQADALRAANEALDAERSMAVSASDAKTAFLGSMSHELRTPLNAILGFSEIMVANPAKSMADRYAGYGKDIHNAAQVLLTFVDQILELSRLETKRTEFNPETLRVRELVDQAIELARQQHGGSPAEIVVLVKEGTGSVEGDEKLLKEALVGLLSRALKFSGPDGSIKIHAAPESENAVRINVSDDGPALDPDELENAFNPFYVRDARVAPKGGSIDLSLSLAKRMVDLHTGVITVEKANGIGTRVSISLPRHPGQSTTHVGA